MWKKIKDKNIQHYWECKDCHKKAVISPDWYENNGTPVCDSCDRDMKYAYTRVKQK